MHEIPLVAFTLIEQTAIGALIAVAVLHLSGKLAIAGAPENAGEAPRGAGQAAFTAGIAVFALAVVGMLVSLGHLGQPLRATNAILNLGSSWLSREILFFSLFAVATLVYALIARKGNGAAAKAVVVVAGVFGVLALISTTLCYLQPGVPAWNTPATAVQFFATAIIAGAPLGVGIVRLAQGDRKRAYIALAVFAVALVVLAVLRVQFFSDIQLLVNMM